MPDLSTRPRRWPWLLAILALAILLAHLALDPQRQTRWFVEHARTDYGVLLALGKPARFRFWPAPALELEGVRAAAMGTPAPMFEAERVAITLPWRALWSATPSVRALTLQAPRFDLVRIADWRRARAGSETGPPAAPRWPEIETPVRVRDARWIVSDEWALEDFDVEIGALASGAPIQLEGGGTLVANGERRPVAISASGTARELPGAGFAVDDLELAAELRGEDVATVRYSLAGKLTWTATRIGFEGRLDAIGADNTTDLALAANDDALHGITLSLKGTLAGADVAGELDFPAGDLSWIEALPRRLNGKLEVPKARIGDVEVEGLTIEAERSGDAGKP